MKAFKNLNSLFFVFAAIFLLAIITIAPKAQSQARAYYSGDAINYNNQIIFGTTNLGYFELFKLKGNSIVRLATIESLKGKLFNNNDYFDCLLNEEAGKLYVYLVDGRNIYKYDITNLSQPVIVNRANDNSNDWFYGLAKTGGKAATIGNKGLKIWNYDLEVIDAFNLTNKMQHNINFSQDGDYIFNLDNNNLYIYDTTIRKNVAETNLSIKDNHFRKPYFDNSEKKLYAVDDSSLNKYLLSASLVKNFKHISHLGYDADGLDNKDYFYFSDGLGVVKIDKKSLKPITWAYTAELGEKRGWAMGLNVVDDVQGEKLVVFNNSSILVLDKNLKLISHIKLVEKDEAPAEDLFLSLDRNRAEPNSYISLRGGGFGLNENLVINFAGKRFDVKTDNSGRFNKLIQVPQALPARTDISVAGEYTGLHYSIAFEIE